MKKYITLVFIAVIMFISPAVVKAAAGISISCPKTTIAYGESITCNVVGTADEKIGGLQFEAGVSGDITFGSLASDTLSASINGTSFAGDGTADGLNSGSTLATITVTANDSGSSGTITLSSATMALKDSGSTEIDDTSIELTLGESSGSGDISGDVSASDSNPKTMDMNLFVLGSLLLGAATVVYLGKKKLNKIGR